MGSAKFKMKPQLTTAEITALDKAYRQTIYEIYHSQQTIQLYIGQLNARLDRLLLKCDRTTWALITAFNPYSQCLSPAENQLRHQALIKYLQPLRLTTIAAAGKDPHGLWTPEQSVCALGITPIQAQETGRVFEQNALVYGELGKSPQLEWL